MKPPQNTKSFNERERSRQLQQAAVVGILGNGFLAIIKILAGIWSSSYSVIADGFDSLSDTATNIISWVTARIIQRPADYRYPFGYRRAEAVGTKLLAYLIVFAGLSLGWESIQLLWKQEVHKIRNYSVLILVMSISLVLKLGIAIWQSTISKRISSPLLQANSMNMWNDVLISAIVLVGLFLSWFKGWYWVDPLLGTLVSLWILYMGIKFIVESSGELMDGVEDKEVYHKFPTTFNNKLNAHV
jgi:cation diffusion facilitator family transporter